MYVSTRNTRTRVPRLSVPHVLRVLMFVCTHVSVYTCVFVYPCIFVHVYLCTCAYVYMCICLHVYLCTCVSVYMFICVHVYLCTCVSVYMCICVHVIESINLNLVNTPGRHQTSVINYTISHLSLFSPYRYGEQGRVRNLRSEFGERYQSIQGGCLVLQKPPGMIHLVPSRT